MSRYACDSQSPQRIEGSTTKARPFKHCTPTPLAHTYFIPVYERLSFTSMSNTEMKGKAECEFTGSGAMRGRGGRS
jgi:hypothetical protein